MHACVVYYMLLQFSFLLLPFMCLCLCVFACVCMYVSFSMGHAA